MVNGWPQDLGSTLITSPILFDIEGDDDLEIFVSVEKKIKVYDYYGIESLQNSLMTRGSNLGTVAVGDLDGDAYVDVVVGSSDRYIYAWELGTSLGDNSKGWPELHHDNKNTGCYDCDRETLICPNGGFAFNGECWYAGQAGQSCTNVCSSAGKTCVDGDWDDSNTCDVCKNFFPSASCSPFPSPDNYKPVYQSSQNKCIVRSDSVSASCIRTVGSGYNRICKCD